MIRFIRFCRSIEKKYVLNFRPYWTETAPSDDTRKRIFLVVMMKRAFLVLKSIVIYFGKSSKFQILQAIINVSKDSFSTTMCVFTAKLNNVAQINDIHEFTDDISKSLFFDCNWTSPLWNLNAKLCWEILELFSNWNLLKSTKDSQFGMANSWNDSWILCRKDFCIRLFRFVALIFQNSSQALNSLRLTHQKPLRFNTIPSIAAHETVVYVRCLLTLYTVNASWGQRKREREQRVRSKKKTNETNEEQLIFYWFILFLSFICLDEQNRFIHVKMLNMFRIITKYIYISIIMDEELEFTLELRKLWIFLKIQ